MPRKKTKAQTTKTAAYKKIDAASKAMGERNDCVVKALAITTGLPYATVHATLKKLGRKDRKATYNHLIPKAITALGFKGIKVPKPAKAKTFITLRKGMRAAKLMEGTFVVYTAGHMAAFVDGKLHDWTVGTKKIIKSIYRIVPVDAQTSPVAPKKAPSAPKPTSKAKKPAGVRAGLTRPYLAGQLIAKHGLDVGVTDAMVAELDALYGKPNPVESKFCLKNAWHAVRAAMEVFNAQQGGK